VWHGRYFHEKTPSSELNPRPYREKPATSSLYGTECIGEVEPKSRRRGRNSISSHEKTQANVGIEIPETNTSAFRPCVTGVKKRRHSEGDQLQDIVGNEESLFDAHPQGTLSHELAHRVTPKTVFRPQPDLDLGIEIAPV
jgi:hypothetical protein